MQIALPEFIAFDSSTLNKISADFWSDNGVNREKARRFLALLTDRGIHIALTLTHVSEMMRHGNSDLVDSRIKFLRQLKLIAWIRPFSGAWFPGSIVDLITRELDAAVHESAKTWSKIVELVRPRLWETGCGRDMFLNDPAFWSTIREKAQDEIQHESVTASIARTDAAGGDDLEARENSADAKKDFAGTRSVFKAICKYDATSIDRSRR